MLMKSTARQPRRRSEAGSFRDDHPEVTFDPGLGRCPNGIAAAGCSWKTQDGSAAGRAVFGPGDDPTVLPFEAALGNWLHPRGPRSLTGSANGRYTFATRIPLRMPTHAGRRKSTG